MIGGIDAPAPVVPLVTGQGHFVGIVPKVILQGGVFRGRCNPIESCLYPMQAGFGHHAVVQREGSEMKRVVGMGVGHTLLRNASPACACQNCAGCSACCSPRAKGGGNAGSHDCRRSLQGREKCLGPGETLASVRAFERFGETRRESRSRACRFFFL